GTRVGWAFVSRRPPRTKASPTKGGRSPGRPAFRLCTPEIRTMQHQLESQTESASSGGHLAEDLLSLLGVVRRGWRFLVVCTAVCLALGLTYAFQSRTSYQASARLLV